MGTLTGGRAVLIGDGTSVAAALAAAGIPVTVVCGRVAATRFSRHASGWLPNPRPDEDALVQLLVRHATGAPGPTALYYQQDEDLLLVSRRRAELEGACRFVVPEADLVEQLVDKSAFQLLADRLDLPVPAARVLDLAHGVPADAGRSGPVLVKPLQRGRGWNAHSTAKAVLMQDHEQAQALLAGLAAHQARVLVQEHVPGPESRIESYHVYVDASGEIAGEFTGRKLRTRPASFGHSTALVTTDSADVAALGRSITERLGLRGVAKLDFKRDPDGRLWLLEANPRFTLWHQVGTAAGVNIPALVWADLMGLPRPPRATARPGVTWCKLDRDWLAARSEGVPLTTWVRWAARSDTRAVGDPMRWLGKALPKASARARLVGAREDSG